MAPVVIEDPLPMVRAGLADALREFGYENVEPVAPIEFLAATPDAVALVTLGPTAEPLLMPLPEDLEGATVVCLVDEWDARLVREAFQGGASGIELRSASPDRIAACLDVARSGDVSLPLGMVRAVVAATQPEPSIQELHWIRRLGQGETVATLARDEAYSERQMFRLLADLWQRLGVSNRHEAIAKLTADG